jgi:hypothetical protein
MWRGTGRGSEWVRGLEENGGVRKWIGRGGKRWFTIFRDMVFLSSPLFDLLSLSPIFMSIPSITTVVIRSAR